MDASDINVLRFQEIKMIIQGLSINSGLTMEESIFVIERAFEKVFFNEYTVQFDDKYEVYATNSEYTHHVKSMEDVKRIRQSIFIDVTETRRRYIDDLKRQISIREIASLIAKEINKLASLNAFNRFNYLIYRYIKGFILSKIDGGYIVNIGIGKVAYFFTDIDCELYKEHIFFVKQIRKDTDSGIIKILLEKPERYKKVIDIYEMFKHRNGKLVKNKIAIRVSNDFVWVFESRHRETLYRQEIKSGDQTARELALLAAKRVFDAYAFGSQMRAEGT